LTQPSATDLQKAAEWLDGPGGDACLASDQSKAVPLLAGLIAESREQGRTDAIEEIMHNPQTSPTSLAAMLVQQGREQERERCADLIQLCACPDCYGAGHTEAMKDCPTCEGVGTLHPLPDLVLRIRSLGDR
jgi:hypothetical protein